MAIEDESGRYLILGTIDGLLAVLGIIIGASASTADAGIILKAALGGGIALALTNGIGSYLAESAVEYGRIASVERAILQDLKDTRIEEQAKHRIVVGSIVHGGASLIGSFIPIVSFLLLPAENALISSILLSLFTLIVLGFYSGKISGQSYLKSILRMVSLGLIIVIVTGLLGLGR
jgi:predicted membrane protein (TIGR00267 family)